MVGLHEAGCAARNEIVHSFLVAGLTFHDTVRGSDCCFGFSRFSLEGIVSNLGEIREVCVRVTRPPRMSRLTPLL